MDMLQSTLDAEEAERWAWDRPNEGSALPAYMPRRDLKEIPGYEKVAKHFKWGVVVFHGSLNLHKSDVYRSE